MEIQIMEIPILETQIIRTDKPNIIIEKTTTEKEIDISDTPEMILNYNAMIIKIQNYITLLTSFKGLPKEILQIVEEKKSLSLGEIASYQGQINKLESYII